MSKLALLGGDKVRKEPLAPKPMISEEEKTGILQVLDSGLLSGFIARHGEMFLGGPKVRELEKLFTEYFGVEYAIAVNSATAGLHAAVAAADIGPGDEVIVPPYTMSATVSAVLMSNAIPVFADIKSDTFCIDPDDIRRKITPRTKAIITVHLFGQAADMDEIMNIADENELIVIEDAAQAPGAKYKDRYVGTIGDMGIFSLNQHKTITTGEGGVVITNNSSFAEKARLVRNHGEIIVSDKEFENIENTLGWNYRMTELEAAVGIAQFKRLDYLNNYRIELADYFIERLKEIGLPGISVPVIKSWNKHVFFVVPITYKEEEVGVGRDMFVKALLAEGIPFGAGYVKPIYQEPLFQRLICYGDRGCPFSCPFYGAAVDYSKGLCPVTERMHEKELLLTAVCSYPNKKSDIDDVIRAFEKINNGIEELKVKV